MIIDIRQRSKKSVLKDQRCKLRHESGPSFFVLLARRKLHCTIASLRFTVYLYLT